MTSYLSWVAPSFLESASGFLKPETDSRLSGCNFRCPTCRIGVKHPNLLDQTSESGISEVIYGFLLSICSILLSDCKFRCPTLRIGVKHPNFLDQTSESGITVLYRGILMFFIISFYRNWNVIIFRIRMMILETSRGTICRITTRRPRPRALRMTGAGEGGECRPPGAPSYPQSCAPRLVPGPFCF